ncbi:MAG: sigma-70 family RNA polymerase sigma factor [Solirubrobacterales bacterium]|nr:sigma-70 family RNA polymerase sigma factor [Solirubrobacterales bacterium]
MEAHPIGTAGPVATGATVRGSSVGDEGLARLAGRGSERAFAALYKRYHQPLYRYCHSLLRHDSDTQDALQSTFISALSALRAGRRDAPLRPWLFRIAHNESVSILRRRRRRPEDELPETLAAPASPIDELAEDHARLERLLADLRELPARQRAALLMRELSGLSHEDIALALGTSVGTAKQTIFEARRSLADFEKGRAMSCREICRLISDGDRRALRARKVRAHLRSCPACSAFATAIPARTAELRALAPALPSGLAGAVLARTLQAGGAGGAAGTGAAGGGAAGGAAGTGAAGGGAAGGGAAGSGGVAASGGAAAGGPGTLAAGTVGKAAFGLATAKTAATVAIVAGATAGAVVALRHRPARHHSAHPAAVSAPAPVGTPAAGGAVRRRATTSAFAGRSASGATARGASPASSRGAGAQGASPASSPGAGAAKSSTHPGAPQPSGSGAAAALAGGRSTSAGGQATAFRGQPATAGSGSPAAGGQSTSAGGQATTTSGEASSSPGHMTTGGQSTTAPSQGADGQGAHGQGDHGQGDHGQAAHGQAAHGQSAHGQTTATGHTSTAGQTTTTGETSTTGQTSAAGQTTTSKTTGKTSPGRESSTSHGHSSSHRDTTSTVTQPPATSSTGAPPADVPPPKKK